MFAVISTIFGLALFACTFGGMGYLAYNGVRDNLQKRISNDQVF